MPTLYNATFADVEATGQSGAAIDVELGYVQMVRSACQGAKKRSRREPVQV